MLAEIFATGDEIRTGALVDTNSAHIARSLEEIGLEVVRHQCAGDDLPRLTAVLQEIGSRADVAVVTGGLGPTADDLSAQAAATAAGLELALDRAGLESIERFYEVLHLAMPPSARKQALLPQGAQCLANPAGTAPGFRLQIGRCAFFSCRGYRQKCAGCFQSRFYPQSSGCRGVCNSLICKKPFPLMA